MAIQLVHTHFDHDMDEVALVLASAALAASDQAGHKQQDCMVEYQDYVVGDMVVAHTAVVVAVDTVEDKTAGYVEQEESQDSS
jgi:hypothetical protein